MIMVRRLNDADRALLGVVLLNAGVKARIRKLRLGYRVVFQGAWEPVAEAINPEGFRTAGSERFGRFSFQGQQAFVRYMEDS